MAKIPWEIKYRPQTFDDYIFQSEKYKEKFKEYVDDGIIHHLLLSGHRGTGKTAIAYLLKTLLNVEDIDFKRINASDENSVDTIRRKVKSFVTEMPFGKFKLIFLDEADALTMQAQESLKSMIEEHADSARFIFTCNKPHKILPEIKSRCHEYNFKSLDKGIMLETIATILSKERVKVDSVEQLEEYVQHAHPDMRKLINSVEQNTINGKLTDWSVADGDGSEHFERVFKMLVCNNVLKDRRYIYENISDDECMSLYRTIIDCVEDIFDDLETQKRAVIIVADCIYRDYFVAFKQATFESCIIKLSNLEV